MVAVCIALAVNKQVFLNMPRPLYYVHFRLQGFPKGLGTGKLTVERVVQYTQSELIRLTL